MRRSIKLDACQLHSVCSTVRADSNAYRMLHEFFNIIHLGKDLFICTARLYVHMARFGRYKQKKEVSLLAFHPGSAMAGPH